jgi:hypothetical protein
LSRAKPIASAFGTLRGALTTTAGVITAVLGVVFLLVPNWKPVPRDKVRASVSIATVEQFVGLEDWAERQYPGDPHKALRRILDHEPTQLDKEQSGLVVYVRLETDGFKRRKIKLRARVYLSGTRRPPQNVDTKVIYPQAGELEIDAPSRSSIQLLYLKDLTVPHTYFVRVEAFDDDGILAYTDSKPITIE